MKRIIRDISKNDRETIRVELDEYNGHQIVSARVWFTKDEALRPTSKGLTIGIKHLPALREAINEAELLAKAGGLL